MNAMTAKRLNWQASTAAMEPRRHVVDDMTNALSRILCGQWEKPNSRAAKPVRRVASAYTTTNLEI